MFDELKRVNISLNLIEVMNDGNNYQVIIQIPTCLGWIEDVKFILDDRVISMNYVKCENDMAYFEANAFIETKAIYHYYFSCLINGKYVSIKSNEEDWKLSVNFEVPVWAKGKMMYHIFVDRFNRGSKEELQEMPRRKIHYNWDEDMIIGPDENGIWNNDFYGGDLLGILNSLEYLKDLGIDIIYLSPIVKSQSNHRYDAADYEEVDPYAGCMEDLKKLCDKAHSLGMYVVLDAVFNHTGNDSKYFNEYGTYDSLGAFQDKNSPYSSFYRKHEENGEIKYDYWWGMKNLPVCDGNSKSWIDYITGKGGIIDKWFSQGIDGLRLDVADELTDNFIELIRKAVKRNKKDGFIIGEVWKNPMRMNRGYISSGKGMDSVMNYLFIDALLRYFKYADTDKLNNIIHEILNEYPEGTIQTLMNFTSTHDITRGVNLFSDEFNYNGQWAWDLKDNDYRRCKNYCLTNQEYERCKEIYKSYVFALTFFPGIFSIFYGDEVGVQGLGNLANRKPFPKDNLDEDLLNYFKMLGQIRKQEVFLRAANLKLLKINSKLLIFERKSDYERMLVAINRTNGDEMFEVPKEYENPVKVYSLKSRLGFLNAYGALAIKGDDRR